MKTFVSRWSPAVTVVRDGYDDGAALAEHERGASAAEYALLVAGVAAVLVVIILLLGGRVQGLFTTACEAISSSSTCT